MVFFLRLRFSWFYCFFSLHVISHAVIAETVSINVHHVSAVEAASLLEEKNDIIVLDVRTGFEYNDGHIESAINYNYYLPGFKIKLSKLEKTSTYLVYCRRGNRSAKTLKFLEDLGFKDIIHMDDGFDAWRKAGLPVSQ